MTEKQLLQKIEAIVKPYVESIEQTGLVVDRLLDVVDEYAEAVRTDAWDGGYDEGYMDAEINCREDYESEYEDGFADGLGER